MKHFYGIMKKILFIACALLFVESTFGQEITVTGKVTGSDDGGELPGVTVSVKGTAKGTITDFDGKYSIKVEQGATLVYSFIGYKSIEVPVTGPTQNVTLELDTKALDEIIVVGYGTVKKDDATGSVVAVSEDDFNRGAITSPQELIVGKTAGVVITTSDGAPGAGATIRIRGGSSLRASNDPLIIIDGVPLDNNSIDGLSNPLSVVNPNDIETFTVLKDASATAIYGARASNGVILITTKKGKEGSDLTLNYNGSFSVGTITDYPELLSGDQFREILWERYEAGQFSEAALSRAGDTNTDWQKEIYQNSVSHDHNVSVSGSFKKLPYRASIGYTDQNGVLKNSNMNRLTGSLNLNPSFLNNTLKVNVSLKGMKINNDFSNTDAIGRAVEFDPTQPITNGNTRYGGYTTWIELSEEDRLNGAPINIATQNPVASLNYRDNTSEGTRFIGNMKIDYKLPFLPELRANLNMAYDGYSTEGVNNTDPLAGWSYREPENNVESYSQDGKHKMLDFYVNYVKDIESISSNIDFTAGYSWEHYHEEGTDSNRPWEMTDGVYEGADTTEYKEENYLVSFFGRLNYTLLDKYLLTATVRRDGSSRFGEDNRWGVFPSFAFAWKIHKESFLANVKALSELKLRLGYGVTGQQDILDNQYPYIPTYRISYTGAYYQFGDKFYPTQRPNAYDANIKWEETTTSNIGLDFSFLDDRISGSLDYYKRETVDLINEIPIAAGTNFSNRLVTNVGSLENKGFEITLNGIVFSTNDMGLEIGANLTYNENEITKLTMVNDPNYTGYDDGGISGGVGNNVQINSVGHPARTFFLFKQIYDEDGMPIEGLYEDKTGEGGVVSGNNSNKYYLQNPSPKYMVGLSLRYNYKNFDIAMNGRLSIDNYVYNNNASNRALYQNLYNQSGYLANIPTSINDTKFQNAQYWSDFYLENGSFFRMDNISLGYNFDQLVSTKLSGRLSFTVQNAFLITKYSGLDPEVENGIDNNIYPRPRTFMLGINLNF